MSKPFNHQEQLAVEVYDHLSLMMHPDPSRREVPISLEYGDKVRIEESPSEIGRWVVASLNDGEAEIHSIGGYEDRDGQDQACLYVVIEKPETVHYSSISPEGPPEAVQAVVERLFTRFSFLAHAAA